MPKNVYKDDEIRAFMFLLFTIETDMCKHEIIVFSEMQKVAYCQGY